MWEHQNKELHSGGQAQQQILHSAVNDQIVTAYTGGAQQLPRDAFHLLHSPIKTILEHPLASKQLWHESIHTAQQCQQQHKLGWYHSEQQFMVTWLQTASHPEMTNTAQSD